MAHKSLQSALAQLFCKTGGYDMSGEQVPVTPQTKTGIPQEHGLIEVARDLAYKRLTLVNVVFVGLPGAGDREWTLIDAGIPGSSASIRRGAEERFGADSRPAAIILTHGHFDHVGALKNLAMEWDSEIFAHRLEQPFLKGRSSYPPPDPTVGGGMMAAVAGLYPRGPIDVSPWLKLLPEEGTVPHMAGWRWLHTPGHAPGHVSLWREQDKTLIAGDAFITTRQESAYAVLTQKPELHGPPMYFTPNWDAAHDSVLQLAALQPEVVISGHGPAMHGSAMRAALDTLAHDFDRIAVPEHGRYVDAPAHAGATGGTGISPEP
jgi:glyoxylase-like metal-dependent hydrolase (beta-lactamase superfamily II)